VKNLKNDKEVIVKVIDRGPYKKGRIIDLTFEAAKQLDMLDDGVVSVEVSVYHPDSVAIASFSPKTTVHQDSIAMMSLLGAVVR
jgi:rare lipoprotein A